MRRYIITKDGKIIDTDLLAKTYDIEIKIGLFGVYLNVYNKAIMTVETYDIVEQADTIEELCDKFVYIKHIDDKTFHYFYNNINTTKNELYDNEGILHYKPRKELEIYGAIWTKKGLIYVAKVNEKGELELL